MNQPQMSLASPTAAIGADRRRLTIGLYAAASFLYWSALSLYVSILPSYVQSKVGDLAVVGVVLSMYGLWQAIIRLPLGIAADWAGWRKPFIVGGMVLAALGAWILATAGSANGLIMGRAVTGLAAGTWVALVAVFSSLFPPREAVRATTWLNLAGMLGRTISTALSGSLTALSPALPFYLSVAAAGLGVVAVLPAVEARRRPQRPAVGAIGRLIIRRDVLLPALLSAVGQYVNWAATFGFVPLLAKRMGATDVVVGLMVSLNVAVLVAGNLVVTSAVRRVGAQRLVYVGFLLQTVGLVGVVSARTLGVLLASQMFIGLSQGIMGPVLMGLSIELVDDGERTTAMGLHQAVYAVGMFAGPVLSGRLAATMGIGPMFAATAVVTLALGLAGTRLLGGRKARG